MRLRTLRTTWQHWSATLARARHRPEAVRRLEALSDADLRRRWHESTPRLRPAGAVRSMEDVLAIVEQRACILDEVEARDPGGFEQWIYAEAGWTV
jgi:hypothetical protein